jgi:hypothetical protein
VTTEDQRRGALDAVDRIINRGGDADDVLRAVLAVLAPLYPFAAIRFKEGGGPEAGQRTERVSRWPIRSHGLDVAELEVADTAPEDGAFLERIALLLSPYCLVGWDTRGEPWEP